MSDPSAIERLVGESVHDDRYAISAVLGQGAQGATLEAIDKLDGSLVAIKRFQVRGARSWKDVELAEREARVLGRLAHPLLPRAIDHFEEDGALYLVMERIEGRPLSVAQGMSTAEVVRFLRDMDEVLGYLHEGAPPVIHRDIKPSNVIRRPPDPELGETRPRHVLVDFGSVRESLKPAGGSTVVGTFGYMAPEQFQGRALPVSDVYGVGATALSLLTGESPESLPHAGLAIDVAAALPNARPELVRALERMLDPDPDRRVTRIAEVLAELEDLADASYAPDGDGGSRRSERKRRKDKRGRSRKRDRKGKRDRKQRRDERRERRRERRDAPAKGRQDGPGLPTIVRTLYRPAVIVAMAIARVAVAVSTQVLIPLLLSLLAIVFGRPLRDASRSVAAAGKRADGAIQSARDYALGRREEHEDDERLRVEDATDDRRARIAPDDDATDEATEDILGEVEAALEEAAEEIEQATERRR